MYDYAKEKDIYITALEGIYEIIKLCPDCDIPGELPLACSECPWRIRGSYCLHALISERISEVKRDYEG